MSFHLWFASQLLQSSGRSCSKLARLSYFDLVLLRCSRTSKHTLKHTHTHTGWVFPKYDHVAVGTGTVINKTSIKQYQQVCTVLCIVFSALLCSRFACVHITATELSD